MGRTDVHSEPGDAGDDPFEAALAAFRVGDPVCIHDFDDREGEIDLVYPADAVDPVDVAQLRNDAGGLICVAFADEIAATAELPYLADALDHPAVTGGELAYGDRPSFSLTVNHRETFTGITDEDRALTIAELGQFAAEAAVGEADATVFAERFRAPGHVHLLRAAPGLLADRRGHTELGVALAREAGISPAVVVCEMLDDDGGATSVERAREYATSRGIPFLDGDRIVAALG